MTLGDLRTDGQDEPVAMVKQTMLRGCEMIDDFLKTLEQPIINPAIVGKNFPKIADVPLLAKPARRSVEVLVYAPRREMVAAITREAWQDSDEGSAWQRRHPERGEIQGYRYDYRISSEATNIFEPPRKSYQIVGNHTGSRLTFRTVVAATHARRSEERWSPAVLDNATIVTTT